MRLFLTKVWGWDVPVGPIQFSTSGWRDNALRQLKTATGWCWWAPWATRPRKMKGGLLGVMEPSREPVMSLDFA